MQALLAYGITEMEKKITEGKYTFLSLFRIRHETIFVNLTHAFPSDYWPHLTAADPVL